MARPSLKSKELCEQICGHIADGKSIRQIEAIDGMPSRDVIRVWLRDDTEFQAHYARAKQEAAEAFADSIVEIADDLNDNPKSRAVRIDARKWIAARLLPKKYGDKIGVEHSAGDGIVDLLKIVRDGE